MKEVWKDIKGYEGLYQISNLGRVKSLERRVRNSETGFRIVRERFLKPALSGEKPRQYYYVILSKNAKHRNETVHRLVAKYFVQNPENKLEVNHIDNDPLNNYCTNLEWCTSRYNKNHGCTFRETSSDYFGVCWDKRVYKWRARIKIDGKEIFLGYFTNELEAAEAYQNALNEILA